MPKIEEPPKPKVQPKPKVAKPTPKSAAAPKKTAAKSLGKDDFSTGMGKKLRVAALKTASAPATTPTEIRGAQFRTFTGERLAAPKADAILRPSTQFTGSITALEHRLASEAGRVAPTAQAQQVTAAAAEVERAYTSGGASAAAAELREQTEGASPDVAADIIQASRPTIDRVTADLGRRAEELDGSQGDRNEAQQEFDGTVADLAAASNHAAESAAKGEAAVQAIGTSITRNIDPENVGAWDEALGNTVTAAAGADLAVEVSRQLAAAGRGDQADDILQNVDEAAGAFNFVFDAASEKVEEANGKLAELVRDWQGVLTDDELKAAIDEYKAGIPEYAVVEEMGGALLDTTRALTSLPAELKGLGHADDLAEAGLSLAQQAPRAGLSTLGTEELAEELERAGDGRSSIYDTLSNLGEGKDFAERMASATLQATVARVSVASAAGDLAGAQRMLDGLAGQAGLFGIDDAAMRGVVGQLDEALNAGSQAASDTALAGLSDKLDDLEGKGVFTATSGVGQTMRAAGLVMGAIGTYGSIEAAVKDPDFENVLGALSSTVGTATGGLELAAGIFNSAKGLNGLVASTGFKALGTAMGGIGAAMSAWSAFQALEDGDPASAGLYAAQAGGAIAMMVGGAAATGVGAAVVLVAAVGIYQLNRIRYSNRHENEDTEAFLRGAGVTNPGVTEHLRNADSGGNSVGPVIKALADQMHVSPQALFDHISRLEPDRVIELVEAMHGIDPNDDGKYPASDASDVFIQNDPGFSDLGRPHTLNGMLLWLEREGFAPPAGSTGWNGVSPG